MERLLGRYEPALFAILRIVAGLLFMFHGLQKLFGWPGKGPTVPIASLLGLAGIIELLCGLLIALGLIAGTAAFIASGQMAVAYFTAHMPHGFFPIVNKGELAVIYCFLFLYIAARGSGIFSIDALIRRPAR
jgi:putative oxidoreductase